MKTVMDYVNQSVEKKRKGDYDGALSLLLQALKVEQRDMVDTYQWSFTMGKLLFIKGEYQESVAKYLDAYKSFRRIPVMGRTEDEMQGALLNIAFHLGAAHIANQRVKFPGAASTPDVAGVLDTYRREIDPYYNKKQKKEKGTISSDWEREFIKAGVMLYEVLKHKGMD